MAAMTAFEQLTLELINRARLDPAAEAARLGIDLNKDLAPGTITAASRAPLTGNSLLVDAALGHSQWMNAADVFSHTGSGGSTVQGRMIAAGYTFSGTWAYGENISWVGDLGAVDHLASTNANHDQLFRSAGHRLNILNGSFREIGIGEHLGQFTNTQGTFNDVMLTQNFGLSGSNVFVTGVAFNDTDKDGFYDVGEARGGVSVTLQNGASVLGSDVTEAAGGYGIGTTSSGALNVSFSGGGLATAVNATVAVAGSNVKVDLVGTGRIQSSASTTLGAGAVELVLLGIDNINGTGNASANLLIGNKGINVLTGLAGNDTYDVGAGDTVVEAVGGGTDRVRSTTISLDLANYANVEEAQVYGSATGLNLTGNANANVLSGISSTAANILTGLGGNDIYYVGVADSIIEALDGGIDTVSSSVTSLNLANYANVENVTLSGTAALRATGNAGANTLNGAANTGANVLTGLGGNDIYTVGAGDTIVEVSGGGTDTVSSSLISLNLASYANVERATLSGSLALNLTGNAGANVLSGNAASNVLTGLGGADVFYFNSALGAGNIDSIADFVAVDDTIWLQDSVMTALGATGVLTAGAFFAGAAAHDATDRIIYNASTGALFYDSNGNLAGGSQQIATLSAGLTLTNSDFVVV